MGLDYRRGEINYRRRESAYISTKKEEAGSTSPVDITAVQKKIEDIIVQPRKTPVKPTAKSLSGLVDDSVRSTRSLTHIEPTKPPSELEEKTANKDEPELSKPQKQPFFGSQKMFTSMAVILFVAGLGISGWGIFTNNKVEQQARTLAEQVIKVEATGNTDGVVDVPDEDSPPPDIDAFVTADPLHPRVISIPSIDSRARILPLGLKDSGKLRAPANIYDAGWYERSATPGKAGAMLVDGHVSGPSKPGVFKKLDVLNEGDKIEVERGDGVAFTYSVVRVETISVEQVNMAKLLVPVIAGKKGLNLITCGGTFNQDTNEYASRTIVYAVQD